MINGDDTVFFLSLTLMSYFTYYEHSYFSFNSYLLAIFISIPSLFKAFESLCFRYDAYKQYIVGAHIFM